MTAAVTLQMWQQPQGTQGGMYCSLDCIGQNHVEGAGCIGSGQIENQGPDTGQQVSTDATHDSLCIGIEAASVS